MGIPRGIGRIKVGIASRLKAGESVPPLAGRCPASKVSVAYETYETTRLLIALVMLSLGDYYDKERLPLYDFPLDRPCPSFLQTLSWSSSVVLSGPRESPSSSEWLSYRFCRVSGLQSSSTFHSNLYRNHRERQPSKTITRKTPDTSGVEESNSPRRVLHFL